MTSEKMKFLAISARTCLSEEEFYNFVTGTRGNRSTAVLELHLSECAACRQELAELADVLHPASGESDQHVPELSHAEMLRSLQTVRDAGQPTRTTHATSWPGYRWLAAAAAVILMVGLGSLGTSRFLQNRRAGDFYAQGKSALQQVYDPQSRAGLRLDLPFQPVAQQRGSADENEPLQNAEKLFYQALAVREGFPEARLGLAYVLLKKADLSKAGEEFQKVLDADSSNMQARLGHGVTQYEAGMAAKDPLERNTRLEGAIADFDRLLQERPIYPEASYNRILALFELGRHKEALKEIDKYLEQDSTLPWAGRLKSLQFRMRLNRQDSVEKEINAAAEKRDELTLAALAQSVPYRIPAAIRTAYRNALSLEGRPPGSGKPDAASLKWAAGVLELSYHAATTDSSGRQVSNFYESLTPSQRFDKKALDMRFRELVEAHRKGNVVGALRGTESLMGGYARLQDHWQLASLHHLRGNCYFYNNMDLERATPEYLQMLHYAEKAGATDLIAMALGGLAASAVENHQYEQGIDYLLRMKKVAGSAGLLPLSAFASRYLGDVYARLNHFEESLSEYSAALALAQQLMDEEVIGVTYGGLASVMEKMDRIPEARRLVHQALRGQDAFNKDGSRRPLYAVQIDRLNLIHREGILALKNGDLATAESCFRENLGVLAAEKMPELEARNQLGLAQVYLLQNDLPKAVDEANKCISGGRHWYPEVGWEALEILGKIAARNGDTTAALDYYRRSIGTLEKYRSEIASADLRFSFFSHRFNPYQEIVSLLYHSGRAAEALQFVERARSMTLRESLAQSSRPASQGKADPSWPELGPADTAFPEDLAILDYFLTPREILLFVSSRQSLQSRSLKIAPDELSALVRQFLESLQKKDASSDERSRQLFGLLFEPVADFVADLKPSTLVILPDGPLHLLPFAALKDQQGRFLVERFPLSYAPSRSILRYCMEKRQGRLTDNPSILLLGGTPDLRGASEEIAHLLQLFGPRATIFDGRDMTLFSRAVDKADIVHFAGHARIREGRANLAFPAENRELLLDPRRIRQLQLKSARLVTLAGCSTGAGPMSEGETPWGLLPAFFSAGASAVMVSLLPLDDTVTGDLCARFYDLLAGRSLSKAAALQQAQVALIRSNNPPSSVAWAPLVLFGDPR